jgi:hypothetical protein
LGPPARGVVFVCNLDVQGRMPHEKYFHLFEPLPDFLQQTIRAAYDAGVKEVLLAEDNLNEANLLPSYIFDAVKLMPVTRIQEVLQHALI